MTSHKALIFHLSILFSGTVTKTTTVFSKLSHLSITLCTPAEPPIGKVPPVPHDAIIAEQLSRNQSKYSWQSTSLQQKKDFRWLYDTANCSFLHTIVRPGSLQVAKSLKHATTVHWHVTDSSLWTSSPTLLASTSKPGCFRVRLLITGTQVVSHSSTLRISRVTTLSRDTQRRDSSTVSNSTTDFNYSARFQLPNLLAK